MPLIVAIEPDSSQAALVASLSPRHLDAEIVVVASADAALRVIDVRVPDLLLTPPLLAARDDAALTARVRDLDDRGTQVPVLVIPVLAPDDDLRTADVERPAGLLTRMRRPKAVARTSKGCAPGVFATQIQEYLARAAAERHDREESARQLASAHTSTATAPLLAELLPLGTAVAFEAREEVEPTLVMPEPSAVFDMPASSAVFDMPAPSAVFDAALTGVPREMPLTASTGVTDVTLDMPVDPPPAVDVDRTAPLVVDVSVPEPHVGDVASTAPCVTDVAPVFEEVVAVASVADPALGNERAAVTIEPLAPAAQEAASPAAVTIANLPGDGAPASDVLSISETSAADDAVEESGRVARVDADELWTALPPPVHVQAPPVEGPALRRTRLPKPAKLPKVKPRRAREKTAVSTAREKRPTQAPPAPQTSKPMQDEWGLYDPEQCGFAALLDRLEEITATSTPDRKRGRRSAIMRR